MWYLLLSQLNSSKILPLVSGNICRYIVLYMPNSCLVFFERFGKVHNWRCNSSHRHSVWMELMICDWDIYFPTFILQNHSILSFILWMGVLFYWKWKELVSNYCQGWEAWNIWNCFIIVIIKDYMNKFYESEIKRPKCEFLMY